MKNTWQSPLVTRAKLHKAQEEATRWKAIADDYFQRLVQNEHELERMDSELTQQAKDIALLKAAVKRLVRERDVKS